MGDSAAIETEQLGKQYGPVRAVSDLSLRVERGEIYAFLGLNGAGKTTTIRMLLGRIRPTAGEARVLGIPIRPGERKAWGAVGHLVEGANAYPELTVRENLDLIRRLRPGTDRPAVARVIEQLALGPYADRRAGTLSQGNAQRLGLAKALLHEPELLLLDEPANGLDPAGIVEIRLLLRKLTREQGVTVFMSSHILAEVSLLADRIGIIHEGELVQELSAAELQERRRRRLLVQTRDCPAAHAVLVAAGYAARLRPDDLIELTGEEPLLRPEEVATRLVAAGHPPRLLTVEQEALEPYFLRLIGRGQGEEL